MKQQKIKKSLGPDFLDPLELGSGYSTRKTNTVVTTVVSPTSPVVEVKPSSPVVTTKPVTGVQVKKASVLLDRRCKEYRDHLLNCFKCGKKGAPQNETSKDVLVSLRALVYSCSNCLPSSDGVCVLCRGLGSDFVCQSCIDYKRGSPSVFHHTCLFSEPDYHPGDNVCPDCREGVTQNEVENGVMVDKEEEEAMSDKEDEMVIENKEELMQEETKDQPETPVNGCNDSETHDSMDTEETQTQEVVSPPDEVVEEAKTASIECEDSASDSNHGRGSTSPVVTTNGTTSNGIPFRSRKPETWTVEEVETFFSSSGFRVEGSVFREQEIDGKSLLLLKREDVLKGLPGIKVGPALKIFSFIHHLQNYFVVTPDRV